MNYGFSKRMAALINVGTSCAMFVGISIAVSCFEGVSSNEVDFDVIFNL